MTVEVRPVSRSCSRAMQRECVETSHQSSPPRCSCTTDSATRRFSATSPEAGRSTTAAVAPRSTPPTSCYGANARAAPRPTSSRRLPSAVGAAQTLSSLFVRPLLDHQLSVRPSRNRSGFSPSASASVSNHRRLR